MAIPAVKGMREEIDKGKIKSWRGDLILTFKPFSKNIQLNGLVDK